MAGKFGGYDDDEDNVLAPKEPQVTSQDPDERKAARALRIKRRQEALKKAEQPADDAALEEEPGLIEIATGTAAEELQRLSLEGAAKVTNVKVTTDEREVTRRRGFADKMQHSTQKIEEEATDAQTQYEAITANWDVIFSINDPLDIEAEMKVQRQKCDDLLAQKDELITELKDDLVLMHAAYHEDLEKQDKDIKELSERIEKQTTIMQKAYDKQLFLIEKAINIERDGMVDYNNKRWEALYKQRDREELAHMAYKTEQLEEHKLELEAIMWDHLEKYREAKIELETLIQELQKELEKLKAVCIINTEKIGYNYQVLKKREEENVFVRSQQKRKLNKMSDVANKLRSKIRKAAEDGGAEEVRADAEIVKLMRTMEELERKSAQFSHVNHYKFSEIWRMSAARCSSLLQEIRDAEVALHAHVLSEPPPQPPHAPPNNPLLKYEHEEAGHPSSALTVKEAVDPNNELAKVAKERLVRHILQLVADNTGFLVEDRLFKLIEKYQMDSQNLCTLDAIFMALEIQAEEDVELLCKTFLNYAFCPICVGMEAASELMEPPTGSPEESQHPSTSAKSARGDRSSVRGRPSIARSLSVSTSRSHVGFKGHDLSPEDQELIAEADEIMMKCGGDLQAADTLVTELYDASVVSGSGKRCVTVSSHLPPHTRTDTFLCPVGHHLEIEPMQVLTALGEFITIFMPPDKKRLYGIWDNLKPPNFDTPSRKLTKEEIEQYWQHWKNTFPPEKDRFWDGLLTGMNNYLPILQERSRLHEEVVHLRRRNSALRRLVRGALPSLPRAAPHHAREPPPAFTATRMDTAPHAYARLPPI